MLASHHQLMAAAVVCALIEDPGVCPGSEYQYLYQGFELYPRLLRLSSKFLA